MSHCEGSFIVTNVDGQWGEHLKKRCNELTEEMGRTKLYNYWKQWWDCADKANEEIPGLQFALCRNDGSLFRECKNIPHDYKQDFKNIENDRLKAKILNLFPCT